MCGIGGGGGGSSQTQNALALTQASIGMRQQGLAEQQYADSRNLFNEVKPLIKEQADRSSQIQGQQLGISDELMDRWRTTYKPLEDKVVGDAMTYDSDSRIQMEAGKADAAVMSAYDRAQKSAARDSLRLGINPNSGKALAIRENGALGTALAQATASSATAEGIRQQAIGMREKAVGMSQPTLDASRTAAGAALSAGASGVAAYGTLAGIQNQGFSTAMGGFNSSANTINSAANTATNIARMDNAAAEASAAETGQLAGMAVKAGASMFS